MARVGESGDLLKCSFCGKSQKQVKKLIAGPGVYICDECIELCNEIIESEVDESQEAGLDALPKPAEIHAFLDEYVVGQETTNKKLAVAVYNHYKRIEIQAREILRIRSLMEQMLANDTGQSVEQISRDIERDKILTAEQAVEYGLIDAVIESRKGAPALA